MIGTAHLYPFLLNCVFHPRFKIAWLPSRLIKGAHEITCTKRMSSVEIVSYVNGNNITGGILGGWCCSHFWSPALRQAYQGH